MDETIGIRELKAHASDILKGVREDGVTYTVTHRGQAIARLTPLRSGADVPAGDRPFASVEETMAAFDALAEEIARHMTPGTAVSAVDMVREQRGDP